MITQYKTQRVGIDARSSPYTEKIYLSPIFKKWHEWFAWYPVKMIYVSNHDDGFAKSIHIHRWVWMKKIWRREVVESPYSTPKIHYEYTTLMDMLKHGH